MHRSALHCFAKILTIFFFFSFFIWTELASATNVFEGIVETKSGPLQGAIVTAKDQESSIEVSVFTDSLGRFAISRLHQRDYELTAKFPGLRSELQVLRNQHAEIKSLEFMLLEDPEFQLREPSSAWLDLLPDGDMKREFILNCTSCHEISHGRIFLNGSPRSSDAWFAAIKMMRGIDVYGLTPPDFDDENYSKWLAKYLSVSNFEKLVPSEGPSGKVLKARITEYPVPVSPCLPHDLVIGPKGKIWITAFYHDVVWSLDPESGSFKTFQVNNQENVMGQVRALTFGPDEMLWVLLGGTESLVRLNPEDGTFKSFPLGMYPHSIEVDSKGYLWFNDYLSPSKRFGSLNPKTGELEIFEVPGKVLEPEEGLPLLYGLSVDQKDVVWGTMLAANKLFRFDSKTKDIRLFEMPAENTGPRRPGIGPDGSIWIPEFNTGTATRFDPETETFTRHSLGVSSLGLYDIAVDQRSGDVWAGASLGSSLIRMNPTTGAKDVYPFPTEPAYPRHIAIDPRNGDVWTTYSSMPDAVPKIVRVELGEE